MVSKCEQAELEMLQKEYEEAEKNEFAKRQTSNYKIWEVWKYPWWELFLIVAVGILFRLILYTMS